MIKYYEFACINEEPTYQSDMGSTIRMNSKMFLCSCVYILSKYGPYCSRQCLPRF